MGDEKKYETRGGNGKQRNDLAGQKRRNDSKPEGAREKGLDRANENRGAREERDAVEKNKKQIVRFKEILHTLE